LIINDIANYIKLSLITLYKLINRKVVVILLSTNKFLAHLNIIYDSIL